LGVPVFRCSPAGQAVAPSLAKRASQNHKRTFRVHPSRGALLLKKAIENGFLT